MQDLKVALEKFCHNFGRDSGDIGSVSFGDVGNVRFPPEIPVSNELVFFYKHMKFDKAIYVGSALSLMMEPFDNLIGALQGWRWVSGKDRIVHESSEWNKSWVIIGNSDDDALYVDTSKEGSPVYGSIQYDRFKIANSLSRFFDVYSDWMRSEKVDFDMDAFDDDFNIKSEFLKKLKNLAEIKLNPDEVDGFFKYFFS